MLWDWPLPSVGVSPTPLGTSPRSLRNVACNCIEAQDCGVSSQHPVHILRDWPLPSVGVSPMPLGTSARSLRNVALYSIDSQDC